MTMKKDVKFEQELTGQFKTDMRNLAIFWLQHSKISIICTLMIKCKVQRSYVRLHWRLMKILKKNWFVLSKMTWRILQIFVHKLKTIDFILETKMAESFTESLFLRYQKISKKAAKLRSFLQCSVHIFLWHDSCIWKINLRILWNHIVKNFQVPVNHNRCDSTISLPKHFLLKVLSNC